MVSITTALRDLARRWKALDGEIKTLKKQIEIVVRGAAPDLIDLFGVGIELAGQFLVTAGDNAQRLHNERPFAKLCGVAPQPASSGRIKGVTVYLAAETAKPIARSTSSQSCDCAATSPPEPMSNDAPTKDSAKEK